LGVRSAQPYLPETTARTRAGRRISEDYAALYSWEDAKMSDENKAVIRRLYGEVWNKRRIEILPEIISPSHALHDPNIADAMVGPEAYARQVTRFVRAFPDLQFTIEDMVCEKDMLAVSWVISGTHKGEFWGVPPTNKKVTMEGITINHLIDGKIMDSDVSMDALGLMRQLGALPDAQKSKGTSAS
jgi:steroid delta-isomerase-like uncharacterized protein